MNAAAIAIREDTIVDRHSPADRLGTLGRYELVKRLAVGGMAELFLARTTGAEGFEKYLAVKRVLPHLASDSHFVDMFLDEARLAALLDHQNIVQVHDCGEDDGAYFLAMEYLHGETVQTLMQEASAQGKRIPLKHALAIAAGMAAALDYAHSKEDLDGAPLHIVHRDIAPSNIIVTYDGAIKLVDFGVARATINTHQTDTGVSVIKGKLSYLSPEQCLGASIDHRSDIFALGIVLYELTTMTRLFPIGSRDKVSVMQRIAGGKIPRPSRVTYPYPAELQRIVLRALDIHPERRYQSAGELLRDLEKFAQRENLSLSTNELGRFVRKLIGWRPEPWRDNSDDRHSAPDGDDPEAPESNVWHRLGVRPLSSPPPGLRRSAELDAVLQLPVLLPSVARGRLGAAHAERTLILHVSGWAWLRAIALAVLVLVLSGGATIAGLAAADAYRGELTMAGLAAPDEDLPATSTTQPAEDTRQSAPDSAEWTGLALAGVASESSVASETVAVSPVNPVSVAEPAGATGEDVIASEDEASGTALPAPADKASDDSSDRESARRDDRQARDKRDAKSKKRRSQRSRRARADRDRGEAASARAGSAWDTDDLFPPSSND